MLKRLIFVLLLGSAVAQVTNPPSGTGTLTSAGLTLNNTSPCGALAVTGSPVTTTGTLNINFTGTNGDVLTFNSSGCLVDSGTLLVSLAPLASPALTGTPTVPTASAATNNTQAASTAYVTTSVSNAIAAVNPAVAVQVATTTFLPNSPTYNNGVAGIGAFITTLTLNSTLVIDGYTPLLNDRVLVKNESGGLGVADNGVYTVSQLAGVGLAWILTRALDFDQASDINNTGAIPVINGTANLQTQWVVTSKVATVGTDAITFTQFSLNPTKILTGAVTYTSSNSNSLSTAISNVGAGGTVYVDGAVSVSSSIVISTANLTIQCLSGTVPVTFTTSGRLLFNAQGETLSGCNLQGPDMASTSGAPIVFGNSADASGGRFMSNSINGWGSTNSNGVALFQNSSHIEVGDNRTGDQAIGSTITVSTASWATPVSGTMFGVETVTATNGSINTGTVNTQNATSGGCAANCVLWVSGATFPTTGPAMTQITINGTSFVVSSVQSSTLLTVSTAPGTLTGVVDSWLPPDFAVGNAVLCKNMSPVGYNQPGDGQSIPFGQLTTVTSPSFTVQQIYNPGTYVSGGTCQVGVGNGDEDIVFNMTGTAKVAADWNIHDNDVDSIVLHNSTPNSIVSGVRVAGNTLHGGLGNSYNWCLEIGPFQGGNSSVPYAFQNIAETGNICKLAADNMNGGFSQSGTQDVIETGPIGYSGGHTYSTQMDENAAAQRLTVTGGLFNGLGGGPIEDLNRVNDSTISSTTMMYPNSAGQFVFLSVANGGVGGTSVNSNSRNTISSNTLIARSNICELQTVLTNNNVCGAQILNAVGAAGTVTVTFTPGVVNPGLAAAQAIVISGNSIAGGCSGSTLNASVTIATVIGGGTGFTVTNASINGQTCTGGKAQSSGLNNPSSTTDVATFSACPHPFKVGDIFSVSGAGVAGYNVTLGTVTAITQLSPCTVTYTGGSSLAQSGSGFVSNFNGKYFWGQLNIASGGSIDHNLIIANNLIGGGTAEGSAVAFNFSNNGTSNTSFDSNSIIQNKTADVAKLYNLAGSGALFPTNTKIEQGDTTNFTSVVNWAAGATISDSSTNPQAISFTGTGVATSSTTIFLYPGNNGTVAGTPLTTATATIEGGWLVAKHAGTLQGLSCTSTAVGVSGVVTLRKNVATTPITCSLAGVTSCNDTTHSGTLAQGDLLSMQVATGATETLANIKCKAYIWYQDN